MYRQLFIGANMKSYSNLISGESDSANSRVNNRLNNKTNNAGNRIYYNNTLHSEYYFTMDLCSQAQMSEDADNILSRMDRLRVLAREQQIKRVKSQRQQISFIF
jgi:hypothetical protein